MKNARIDSESTSRRWSCGSKRRVERRTFRPNAMLSLGLVGLLLASCSSDGTSSEQTPSATSTTTSVTTPPADTSTTPPSETSPPPTTTGPTLPPGPPAFDSQAVGNNLMLPSFVVTVTVDNTNSGQLNETITTTGYINDPFSVYQLASFSYDGVTDGQREYVVNGRSYQENVSGDWYLYEAGSPAAPNYSGSVDLRLGTLGGVSNAEFAGQGDVAGLPANHFVFDETDLTNYASYTPEHPSPTVEGDFYLAQEGNYVLYTHSKETSPGRTYEVTEALSSVGQVAEITLPEELTPMTQALDTGVALGSLLPPGSSLLAMIRYVRGIGIDYYSYKTSVRTNDEFLTFFRGLPPTNGWSVSHIGHIKPHLEQFDCEISFECVILNNGGDQIVVSFGGTISVEYDRDHVFSPV